MLKDLWKIIQQQDNLVVEARGRSVAMLRTTHDMFSTVMRALLEENISTRRRVAEIDKEINHEQREVRRMVFEHLALSSGRDLIEGLRLITVVIDIERIGDLSKNIEELLLMFPKGFDPTSVPPGDKAQVLQKIQRDALQTFDLTLKAFADDDEEAGRQAIASYDRVAIACEEQLRLVLGTENDDDSLQKATLGLLILLRYIKRSSGHLKNIASAVINPFDRIGFREGLR